MTFRLRLGLLAAEAAGLASRMLGRGQGVAIKGRVLVAIAPDALRELSAGRRVVLVSGTNGKTSTTALLVSMLSPLGAIATNGTGANLTGGVAAALAAQPRAATVVLEVDEMHLPMMLDALRPIAVVLLNLSRDQLHRTQEVRVVANRWREAFDRHPEVPVIVDYEDPFLAFVTQAHERTTRIGFGYRMHIDAACCPGCSYPLNWTPPRYHCEQCGLGGLTVDVQEPAADAIQRNAALARAAARFLGVADPPLDMTRDRVASLRLGERELHLRLVKNPASWTEALQHLPEGPVILAVNARGVDGRDTSWLWDIDYTPLIGHPVVVTGDRRLDAAYRIGVAGVPHQLADDLEQATSAIPAGSAPATVLMSYTAYIAVAS